MIRKGDVVWRAAKWCDGIVVGRATVVGGTKRLRIYEITDAAAFDFGITCESSDVSNSKSDALKRLAIKLDNEAKELEQKSCRLRILAAQCERDSFEPEE